MIDDSSMQDPDTYKDTLPIFYLYIVIFIHKPKRQCERTRESNPTNNLCGMTS